MLYNHHLTGYDNASVFSPPFHRLVSSVGQSEDVRWALVDLSTAVHFDRVLFVDVHRLVRIDRDDHLTDVRVDLTLLKANANTHVELT